MQLWRKCLPIGRWAWIYTVVTQQCCALQANFMLASSLSTTSTLQVKKTKVWGDENRSWNLFIVRFYDCELCSGEKMTPDSLAECHKAVLEHYDFSYCRLQR